MNTSPMQSPKDVRVSAQKLHFIQKSLENLGLNPDDSLDQILETLNSEDEHKQTVSFNDVLKIYGSISNIKTPAIGMNIGRRISCGDYGLYGCTLLCKSSLEDALHFSIKYHKLVTRTTRLYLEEKDNETIKYGCSDILFNPEIKTFNLEMQLAINLTLIREVLGDKNYAPMHVAYELKRPSYFKKLEEFTGCAISYEQDATFIALNKEHLSRPLLKSNPLAVPLLLQMCDQHIPDFAHVDEIVERVYNWVSRNIHNDLKIDRIAEELFVSERTLRRKLSDQGTSFSIICSTIKQSFAKQYIRDTQLSFDDVAESLGFKDTSNFRHAFKDWTGMTPTQFRNRKNNN